MSRFRKVDPRMWGDSKFRRLSPIPPCGRGLWLYLLTCPEATSLPGVIVAGRAALAEALDWSTEAFGEAFGEAFREGLAKADFVARVVWLPNACRYNAPESPNVVRGWRDHWDNVPECSLKTEAWYALKAFCEGLGEAFGKAFREACAQPLANQEQDPDPDLPSLSRSGSLLSSDPDPPVRSGSRGRAKGSLVKRQLPQDWKPSDAHEVEAKSLGVSCPCEAQKFRDYCQANGKRYADFEAAFRNWLRRAAEYCGANGQRGPATTPSADRIRQTIEQFEREGSDRVPY